MNGKKIVYLVGVVIALMFLVGATGESTSVGRYLLSFGRVDQSYTIGSSDNMRVSNVCFKIDTATGRVWKYEFSDYRPEDKSKRHLIERFIEIEEGMKGVFIPDPNNTDILVPITKRQK